MNIPPVKSLAPFRINTESLEVSQHLGVTWSTSTTHVRRQCWNLPPHPPQPPHPLFTQVTCHRRSCQRKPRLSLAQITKRLGWKVCANSSNTPAIFSKALRGILSEAIHEIFKCASHHTMAIMTVNMCVFIEMVPLQPRSDCAAPPLRVSITHIDDLCASQLHTGASF